MAQIVTPNKPTNATIKKAVGVALPFSKPSVFTQTYTTADQLKSNLKNYFLTEPGERYMNPDFGFGLKRRLFEQLNNQTYSSVQKQIQKDVERLFPSVTVTELDVFGNEDRNELHIIFKYSVKPYNIDDTLEITI